MKLGLQPVENAPESWVRMPLHAVGNQSLERNKGLMNDNLLSLSFGTIKRKDIDSNEGLLPDNFETYQIVSPGDIIFRFTDLQNDLRSLRSAIVTESGIITSAYLCFRPNQKRISPQYLNYLMRAYDLAKVFYAFGGGVRQSLKFDEVRNLPIALPPRDEQDAIVAFLDKELVKLDLLLDKFNQLLGSLDELRVSIIDQALAQINSPEITKIKYACLLNCSPKRSSEALVDFFPMDAISEWNGLRFGDQIDPSEASSGYSLIRENDVVIAKVTPCFENRKGTVIPKLTSDFALATTELLVLTPASGFDSKFVRFVLTSSNFIKEGEKSMTGAGGLKRIPSSFLANYVIPKISLEEQQKFISYVESQMQTLTTLESSLKAASELLRMRRIALVSAAVTGKIEKGSF